MSLILFLIGIIFIIVKVVDEKKPSKHTYNNTTLLHQDHLNGKSFKWCEEQMKKGRYD